MNTPAKEEVLRFIERVIPYTKAPPVRLHSMVSALKKLDKNNIEGDVVECGVWKGGHIILSRLVSPNRMNWLFDTFAGMTMPTEVDTRRDGASAIEKFNYKVSMGKSWTAAYLYEVEANLRAEGVYDKDKLRFVQGDVCVTLDEFRDKLPEKIALLRLDTDWYESTKKELEVLWPRLVDNGIVIIDDYGHWLGCRKAVQEYFSKHYPAYVTELKPIDYSASYMVKQCKDPSG